MKIEKPVNKNMFFETPLSSDHQDKKKHWIMRTLLRIIPFTNPKRHMENTVIQFIVDNIFFFLPLGITGIIVTILLYITGKKEGIGEIDDLSSDYTTIVHIKVNIFMLIYFFVWITIFIIGLLSDFLIPTIIGGIIALIPFFILLGSNHKKKNSKVS